MSASSRDVKEAIQKSALQSRSNSQAQIQDPSLAQDLQLLLENQPINLTQAVESFFHRFLIEHGTQAGMFGICVLDECLELLKPSKINHISLVFSLCQHFIALNNYSSLISIAYHKNPALDSKELLKHLEPQLKKLNNPLSKKILQKSMQTYIFCLQHESKHQVATKLGAQVPLKQVLRLSLQEQGEDFKKLADLTPQEFYIKYLYGRIEALLRYKLETLAINSSADARNEQGPGFLNLKTIPEETAEKNVIDITQEALKLLSCLPSNQNLAPYHSDISDIRSQQIERIKANPSFQRLEKALNLGFINKISSHLSNKARAWFNATLAYEDVEARTDIEAELILLCFDPKFKKGYTPKQETQNPYLDYLLTLQERNYEISSHQRDLLNSTWSMKTESILKLSKQHAAHLNFGDIRSLEVTPLMLATLAQNKSVVRALLHSGLADPNLQSFGITALHLAIAFNAQGILAEFMKYHLNTGGLFLKLEARAGSCLATPLITAAYVGNLRACEFLIQAGVDINAQNPQGHSPLHAACLNEHLEPKTRLAIVQLLIKQGANLSGFSALSPSENNIALFSPLIQEQLNAALDRFVQAIENPNSLTNPDLKILIELAQRFKLVDPNDARLEALLLESLKQEDFGYAEMLTQKYGLDLHLKKYSVEDLKFYLYKMTTASNDYSGLVESLIPILKQKGSLPVSELNHLLLLAVQSNSQAKKEQLIQVLIKNGADLSSLPKEPCQSLEESALNFVQTGFYKDALYLLKSNSSIRNYARLYLTLNNFSVFGYDITGIVSSSRKEGVELLTYLEEKLFKNRDHKDSASGKDGKTALPSTERDLLLQIFNENLEQRRFNALSDLLSNPSVVECVGKETLHQIITAELAKFIRSKQYALAKLFLVWINESNMSSDKAAAISIAEPVSLLRVLMFGAMKNNWLSGPDLNTKPWQESFGNLLAYTLKQSNEIANHRADFLEVLRYIAVQQPLLKAELDSILGNEEVASIFGKPELAKIIVENLKISDISETCFAYLNANPDLLTNTSLEKSILEIFKESLKNPEEISKSKQILISFLNLGSLPEGLKDYFEVLITEAQNAVSGLSKEKSSSYFYKFSEGSIKAAQEILNDLNQRLTSTQPSSERRVENTLTAS
ncbi:MAG: ankyrin repeat domain-containing protein [Gammaproteobacteria bacterium]